MSDRDLDTYIDRDEILAELAYSRRICAQYSWPLIDVTRRSIEETAATIIKLHSQKIADEKKEDASDV